jgi:uncharacterized membrane protein (DUF4010 family)
VVKSCYIQYHYLQTAVEMHSANANVSKFSWAELLLFASFICSYFFVVPLIPDVDFGPYQAINLHDIARLLIAILMVSLAGRLSVNAFGGRSGLLMTGFFGGFASSTATIAAMGALARREPTAMWGASIAAILSTVSTYIQLAFILWLTNVGVLSKIALPLLCGGGAVAAFTVLALKSRGIQAPAHIKESRLLATLRNALLVGILLTVVLVLGSALQSRLGVKGLALISFVSGFLDGHAAAFAVSELVTLKKVTVDAAVIPILLGLTSNTITKSVFAIVAGGSGYASRVIAGLAISMLLTWAPLIILI